MKTLIRAKEISNGIYLKTRENGKFNIEFIPFENYFYISLQDYNVAVNHIKNKKIIDKILSKCMIKLSKNSGYMKVFLLDNERRNELKYLFESIGVEHYEADIISTKRWLLDNIETPINAEGLNYVFYDIETKDDGLFQKDFNGSIIAIEPILSIAYIDNTGAELWLRNDNLNNPIDGEKELLIKHNEIMSQYDCILAWNGTRFDDTYVKQRNEFHKLSNLHFEFINQVDYMEILKKNYVGLESYSLNNVAKVVVKDLKLELDGTKGKGAIYNLWKKSFEGDYNLKDYNMQDVRLMVKIEKKLNFITLHKKQANLVHCFIQETLHNSEICDYMLLHRFTKQGLISPSKPNPQQVEIRKQRSILGAYTFCKNPGIHDNVFVFDFKSFYPTAMASNNICLTTLLYHNELHDKENYVTIPENYLERNGGMEKADTKYFDNSKRGIISYLANDLIIERDKVKYAKFQYIETDPDKFKEMKLDENAIKTIANSLYGSLNFIYFRYYNFDVASSITQFCRGIIHEVIDLAEKLGFKVIQGDTDSIMFSQGNSKISYKDLEYEFYELFSEIAKMRNINCRNFELKNPKTKQIETKTHFIVFEHEKTFKKMISVKKKNYASLSEVMDGDGNFTGLTEVNITGLECKKKDTNPLAKKIQRDLVEQILNQTFDLEKFYKELEFLREQVKKNQLDEKYLIMKKALNKNPEDYGGFMLDGKTGKPKLKKDGTPRIVSVPAHVKLAMNLIKKGEDIYVGDNINYIVKSTFPIEAISVDEYREGFDYARDYYWERITKPLLKILFVTHPKSIVKNYKLWSIENLDEKKATRLINKLQTQIDKDEETSN